MTVSCSPPKLFNSATIGAAGPAFRSKSGRNPCALGRLHYFRHQRHLLPANAGENQLPASKPSMYPT